MGNSIGNTYMDVGVLCYNDYDQFYEAFKLVAMPVLLSWENHASVRNYYMTVVNKR